MKVEKTTQKVTKTVEVDEEVFVLTLTAKEALTLRRHLWLVASYDTMPSEIEVEIKRASKHAHFTYLDLLDVTREADYNTLPWKRWDEE